MVLYPKSKLLRRRIRMIKLHGWKNFVAVWMLCATTSITLAAQTFTTLHSFTGADGANPYAGLTQGADGNFYGTTNDGGAYSSGNVIKVTPSGTVTSIYDFCSQSNCPDGQYPVSTLVLGNDGNFYGTTQNGGIYNPLYGTIFKVSPTGALTTLHSFNATDGVSPYGSLLLASNGNFYGTTTEGGTCIGTGGCGTIFMMTPSGTFTTLYNFCLQSGCPDGQYPGGDLMEASDGNLYGTTHGGGNFTYCPQSGCGTVFKLTLSGTLTTLHTFAKREGEYPAPGLVEGAKGTFYGSTGAGGTGDLGTIFTINSSGTVTTLYSFDGTDGSGPYTLTAGSDGNFYGTAVGGGSGDQGTIFEITPSGTLTTLYPFSGTFYYYFGALTQATNGTFYGTTYFGGADSDGTIYSLSTGLKPFVSVQPRSGNVGATVRILGNNLTSATSVTFHGTPATFQVVSKNLITATVPVGATSGRVEVMSSNHSLLSNVPFVVAP
jgi:uncharacterized repeat protein (TIGR03803 family)